MPTAPNILLIMADQLAPQVLPAYGHRVVRAPNLDALSDTGVVFENAYCNFPLCAPARYSMMSGRLPSRIDAFDNAVEFAASTPTFAHYLRQAGYRTCLSGKMHFVGPDQLHGFEERITTDVYPADFLWTVDWDLDDESWVPWYHSMRAVLDAGIHRRSVNIAYDDEVESEAVRWLHEHADSNDDRPFMLTVSMISPHDPYLAPSHWWNLYDDGDIDLPAVGDIPLESRDPHSRRHYYLTGRHLEAIGDDDLRRMRHAYYAVTSYVDAKVGRLMETLDAIGEADRTLVIFTADHGDSLGERGLFFKMSFFEWSARVPMILHAPWAFSPRRVAQNVSLVDLFPTLLETAGGGELPELIDPIDGHGLATLASGGSSQWPDIALSEYTAEGTRAPLFMVRKGNHKYICGPADPPLLFDLESDPDELMDLTGNADYAQMEKELQSIASKTWDAGAIDARARQSQARRRLVSGALGVGTHSPWDYQPFRDASKLYFREEGDVQDYYRAD